MWETLLIWISIVGFILAISKALEMVIKPDARKEIVDWLINFRNRQLSDIVTSCNRIFLRLFDYIYTCGDSFCSKLFWTVIIYSNVIALSIVPMSWLFNFSLPNLEFILLLSFSLSLIFIFIIISYDLYEKIEHYSLFSFHEIIGAFLIWLGIGLFILVTLKYLLRPEVLEPFIYSELDFVLFMWFITFVFIIGFFGLAITEIENLVSPYRAILSSIVVIAILTLLCPQAAQSFILEFKQVGWSLLSIGLLNTFTDSLSLMETRAVLRLGVKGSVHRFCALLLLDLLATTFIFLAIPLATGNMDIFLNAIIFRDHLWLGILFWSTFSTSICFYLFLLSSLSLAMLHEAVRGFLGLERIFLISEKPILCLGLVAAFIFTILYTLLNLVI